MLLCYLSEAAVEVNHFVKQNNYSYESMRLKKELKMISELNKLECCTFFVEDLRSVKEFYQQVFGLKKIYEDGVSTVFKFDNLMINLLQISEAPQLIEPAKVASASVGSRTMFTILVQNVDLVCEQLSAHKVDLLNGPVDRPWGRRTAAFRDPAGNAWEVAQEI